MLLNLLNKICKNRKLGIAILPDLCYNTIRG